MKRSPGGRKINQNGKIGGWPPMSGVLITTSAHNSVLFLLTSLTDFIPLFTGMNAANTEYGWARSKGAPMKNFLKKCLIFSVFLNVWTNAAFAFSFLAN